MTMPTDVYGPTPLDDDLQGVIVTDPHEIARARERYRRAWGEEPPLRPDEHDQSEAARSA